MGKQSRVLTEIIVNTTASETRVAIMEDHRLVEFFAEREESARIVGNLYKGRVNAVLPGMQAAFVDIGLEKTGFLHVSDMILDDVEGDERTTRSRKVPRNVSIDQLLRKGQEILVQVTKEPIGTKGPRITTQVSLPGRFVVVMPNVTHIGVSRKIEDRDERTRLRALVEEVSPKGYGVIVRTVGKKTDERAIKTDIETLITKWKRIQGAYARKSTPSLLHQDAELTTGIIRDIFTDEVDRLIIDSKTEYKAIIKYLQSISPELIDRVVNYEEEAPIFDAYEIEAEIEKALSPKIWLRKGGYIIVDHAEALVAIDVNTGRFTGDKNQEETIVQTNIEAAKEVARQLRLRDAGGIIVIDFIDMEREDNKAKVINTLRDALLRDRAKTRTFTVSDLGLVEMTRQRVRPSLLHYFSSNCPHCGGSGKRLSLASLAAKVDRLLRRTGTYCEDKNVEIQLNPELAHFFDESEKDRLEGIRKRYGLEALITANAGLDREEVRIFSRPSGQELTDKVQF